MPTGPTGPSAASEVETFRQLLLGGELDIEAPISEDEVLSALALFSISTVLLAGMSRRRVGNEDKVDVLGVLTLYYGLQDKSLSSRIVLNTQKLWQSTINGTSVGARDYVAREMAMMEEVRQRASRDALEDRFMHLKLG